MPELILDLDVGNTNTKWRFPEMTGGRFENKNFERLKKLVSIRPERIRVACVAGEVYKLKLSNALREYFDCEPEFAQSSTECAGVQNAYMCPVTLGVDRWLAGVAAWNQSGGAPCLVVDAGSALTIDTIERGIFRGGYIIPGLGMMQRCLTGNTGKVLCDIGWSIDMEYLSTPTDTQQAVCRGASFAVCAVTEKAVSLFLLRWPHGKVLFTGGDGADLARTLNRESDYKPDLVLDGLALALPSHHAIDI